MMYLHGTIHAIPVNPLIAKDEVWYQCVIKTPMLCVDKLSFRSRMEALTECLKMVGLPMENNVNIRPKCVCVNPKIAKNCKCLSCSLGQNKCHKCGYDVGSGLKVMNNV